MSGRKRKYGGNSSSSFFDSGPNREELVAQLRKTQLANEIYKKALLNANQHLAKKPSLSEDDQQEKLEMPAAGGAEEEGRNPLELMPKEVNKILFLEGGNGRKGLELILSELLSLMRCLCLGIDVGCCVRTD